MAGAAMLAAAVMLAWQAPAAVRLALGEGLGIGIALLAGSGILGRWVRWSLAESEDRLLLIVLPATIVAEVFAAFRAVPRWLAWAVRFIVAAGVAPVLLFNSLYLADSAGPQTRLWTDGQTVLWLGGLAAALGTVWLLLVLLARRGPSRSVLLSLAVVCAGAAPTLMVSGYLTGGALLIPFAAALMGTAAASCVWIVPHGDSTAVGFGVVLLFALLVMGRFFADLGNVSAGLLLFAPLLAWLPEFLPGKRFPPWMRAISRIALVTVPAALAFYLAQSCFIWPPSFFELKSEWRSSGPLCLHKGTSRAGT